MASSLKNPRIKPHARSEVAKILRRARDKELRASRIHLSEDEVKQQIQLTQEEMAALNQIAAGRPMRNAGEVLRALKLKMEFSVKKPVQEVSTDQKITVEVNTLGPEMPLVVAAPDVDDIVRKTIVPEKEDPDEV